MTRVRQVSARLPVCPLRRTRTVDCRLLPDANAQPIDRVSRGCDAFPAYLKELSLLFLYLPFATLLVFLTREVAAGKATISYASMLAFACIYGLLFSPLTFLMLYAGDAFKLLLLLALLVVAARSPMRSEYFGDLAVHDAMKTHCQL